MTEGTTGELATLMEKAADIPLPSLVKAAAGGGGKGMRIVRDLNDLPGILESTSREAKAYFGDGTVFIEKYVEEPRHIEIQVMGDNYGNVVHLYERECSIQRRYQKIIEESPSVSLSPEVRLRMGEAAVRIASEIEYNSAGTVEFLVDKELNFYFLEMNTRIQVEHPVTEMVTEIDIVMEQILVAAGNELSFSQENIYQDGHAIECRIYAEDPSNNFLPSPGRMSLYLEPEGDDIRIDTGIKEATTIHSFFDPMISKLIVWAETREDAREKMISALEYYSIHGIQTNISFLLQVLQNKAYIENAISTKYCDDHTENLIEQGKIEKAELDHNLPALAYLMYSLHEDLLYDHEEDASVWKEIGFWRDWMKVTMTCDDASLAIEITKSKNGQFNFFVGNMEYDASLLTMEHEYLEAVFNGDEEVFFISKDDKGQGYVSFDGFIFKLGRADVLIEEDVFGTHDSTVGDGQIVSPMPGKVIKINVTENQPVKKGDILLVVEAMKMENNIVSPKDGIIEKIQVKPGDMVDGSIQLVILEEKG